MFFSRNKVVVRNREDHTVSRKQIDPDALRVLYRLSDAGFTAYLVGGSVRDLLLGRQPKDFDIGTDAHPAQIRKLFRNCFLIGRRFRLAHIVFGKKVIETSTFRRQPQAEEADEGVPGGLYQHEDNTFGTPEEDARRRDFTVNGLFYDIRTFSIIDYVGGLRDLESRTLRTIGDPNIRFREDPVRMMRAVRFAGRLDLRMDWGCRRAIHRHYGEIVRATKPRVLEEIMRLFSHRSAAPTFQLLWEHQLLSVLLPEVHAYIEQNGGARAALWPHLAALDGDPLPDSSNGLRLAALYAPLFQARMQALSGGRTHVNGLVVAQEVLEPLMSRMQVPRQTFYTACTLLDAQRRFEEDGSRRPRRVRLHHPELFNEALALRRITLTAAGKNLDSLHEWESLAAHPQPAHPMPPHGSAGSPVGARMTDADEAPGMVDADAEAAPDADATPDTGVAPAPHRRRRRRGGRGRGRTPHADAPPSGAPGTPPVLPPAAASGIATSTPAAPKTADPVHAHAGGDSDFPADAG